MTVVIGIKEQQGTFAGSSGKEVTYDNVILCLVNDQDLEMKGYTASHVKLRRSEVEKCLNVADLTSLLGCSVEMVYTVGLKGTPVISGINVVGDSRPLTFGLGDTELVAQILEERKAAQKEVRK